MARSAHDGVAVTCSAVAPFVVTWASEGWLQLCCFSEGEVVGNTLTLIQGPATNLELLKTMMASIKAGVAPNGELTLINYDKYLRPFVHTVLVKALRDESGRTTHFHASSTSIKLLNREHRTSSIDETTAARVLHDLRQSQVVASNAAGFSFDRLERALPCTTLCKPPSAPTAALGLGTHEVVTQASSPFAVVWASAGWLATCGFRLDEIVGRDLRCIQGVATDPAVIAELMRAARKGEAARGLTLVNYDKQRRPFKHTLTVIPVDGGQHKGGGAPTAMFRAESSNVQLSCGGVFQQEVCARDKEAEEEELDFWGEEFEEFQMSVRHFAEALETGASRGRI